CDRHYNIHVPWWCCLCLVVQPLTRDLSYSPPLHWPAVPLALADKPRWEDGQSEPAQLWARVPFLASVVMPSPQCPLCSACATNTSSRTNVEQSWDRKVKKPQVFGVINVLKKTKNKREGAAVKGVFSDLDPDIPKPLKPGMMLNRGHLHRPPTAVAKS